MIFRCVSETIKAVHYGSIADRHTSPEPFQMPSDNRQREAVLLGSACQRLRDLQFKYRAHRIDCCRLVNFLEGLNL